MHRYDSSTDDHEARLHGDGGSDDFFAEVQELQQELHELAHRSQAARGGHKAEMRALAEAKESLYQEADLYHDLRQDLDERESEHRCLVRHLDVLHEELHDEMGVVEVERLQLEQLEQKAEEQQKVCRALQLRHMEMEAQLQSVEDRSASNDKHSWRRTALQAKIGRLQDQMGSHFRGLHTYRDLHARQESLALTIRGELQQAEQILHHEDAVSSAASERLEHVTQHLNRSEAELDSCNNELRMLSRGDSDEMSVELGRRRKRAAEAEHAYVEAAARLHAAERRLGPLEAALEESRRARKGAAGARVAAELAVSRSELEAQEEEARTLRREIAAARQRHVEAAEAKEARHSAHLEAEAMAEAMAKAKDAFGVQASVLEFQMLLREREQAHRESQAGEIEARHQRELRLLAAALHRLGMRYGRLLVQCEQLAAEEAAEHPPGGA